MSAHVITKISISASPAEVYVYLTDTKYHHLWNPHIERIEPLAVLSEGMTYETDSVVLGVKIKAKNVVLKIVKNKELQIENNAGMLRYAVSYKLRLEAESTHLTCTTAVSTDSKAFAFAKPVLQQLARRELKADLQALKNAVEHKLT